MRIPRKSLQKALDLFAATFGPSIQLAIRFYETDGVGRCSMTGDGIGMSMRCQFNCPVEKFKDPIFIGLGEFSAFVNGVKFDELTFKENKKTHVISAGAAKLTRQKNFEALQENNTHWDKLDKFPRQLVFPTVSIIARLSKPLYRMVSSAADEILKTVRVESTEGSLSLFGTDQFRLAEAKIVTDDESIDLVLPAKVFSALSLFDTSQNELKIGVRRTNWLVETSRDTDDFSVQLYGSQILGTYPDLTILFVDVPKSAAYVNTEILANELRLHSAVDKVNKFTVGTLKFGKKELELVTHGATSLSTTISDGDYKAPTADFEVNVRFKYLLDALDFVNCETVALGPTEKRGMFQVTPVTNTDGVTLQCLIAPINL